MEKQTKLESVNKSFGESITPVVKPYFEITYDPKTKIMEELVGYDKDGNEVWVVIPKSP